MLAARVDGFRPEFACNWVGPVIRLQHPRSITLPCLRWRWQFAVHPGHLGDPAGVRGGTPEGVGRGVSANVLPLPVRPTVWVPALSVIVTVPEAEPSTVGTNVTWMVHDAVGAMLPPQLFVWLNGAVATTLETCNGPVPVLCRIMFFVEPLALDPIHRQGAAEGAREGKIQVTLPPLPPPEQLSTVELLENVVWIAVLPSVDRNVRVPPAMVKMPGGFAALVPPDNEPPEFVKPP